MEPVTAAFTGQRTLGETIESLRELLKTRFITYVWVIDDAQRLLGIVTMRDLLFNDRSTLLADVMLRDVFALEADAPMMDAMKLVLDRHYPVYPVVGAHRHLVGLVRGPMMFEAQAIEISLQAGSMVGLEKRGAPGDAVDGEFEDAASMAATQSVDRVRRGRRCRTFPGHDRSARHPGAVPSRARGSIGQHRLPGTRRHAARHDAWRGEARHAVGDAGQQGAWVGCLNGAGVGLVAAIGMYLVARQQHQSQPLILAAVVLGAMIASCAASGVSGAMVPLVLKRLGFDPATASSIFLTTASDVLSMGLLLGLATMFVP